MERFKNVRELINSISLTELNNHSNDKEYLLKLEEDIKLYVLNWATEKEKNEIYRNYAGLEMLCILCDGYKRLEKKK